MPAGRPPKSAELRDAQGNPGKRAVHRAPADLKSAATEPPKQLKHRAKKIWQAVAPELIRINFLRATDVEAFARYCVHLSDWWELDQDIRKEGLTYETDSKHGRMLRINPKFLVRDRIEKKLTDLEDRFGLTTRARQQILQQLANSVPAAPRLPMEDDNQQAAEAAPAKAGVTGFLNNTGSVH